jgi:hypothetical protein
MKNAPETLRSQRDVRLKPPCPAFWGVAPTNMKIDLVTGWTSDSIFELIPSFHIGASSQILEIDRKDQAKGEAKNLEPLTPWNLEPLIFLMQSSNYPA